MNILQIASGRGVNGALVYCKLLTEVLAARGNRMTILCRGGWLKSRSFGENIEVIESPMTRFPSSELKRVQEIIRRKKIDLINTHQTRAHTFGVMLKMRTGIPVVATAHNCRFHLHWNLNDFVIANSNATYDFHRRTSMVPASKMKTIYCFSDLADFQHVDRERSSKMIRRRHRLGANDFLLAVVGQVAERKGQHVLFQGIRQLNEAIPNLKILLVGRFGRRQKYVKKLRSFLVDHDLIGQVKWLGRRNDVADYMAASQMVVVPSIEEPLGLMALEAMTVGTPVVATDAGGLAEIVLDGKTGLSVEKNNSRELVRTIIRLSREPELAQKLVVGGKEFVSQNFAPEPLVDQVQMVYQSILRQRRAA